MCVLSSDATLQYMNSIDILQVSNQKETRQFKNPRLIKLIVHCRHHCQFFIKKKRNAYKHTWFQERSLNNGRENQRGNQDIFIRIRSRKSKLIKYVLVRIIYAQPTLNFSRRVNLEYFFIRISKSYINPQGGVVLKFGFSSK